MKIIDLGDLDLRGKRVLIREDLNVPVEDGRVTSEARILAALPTIKYVLEAGAHLMVMSHLGRPKEGISIARQPEASMRPVVDCVARLLGKKIRLVDDYLSGVDFADEDFIMFENVRVNDGEKANDERLAKQLASLCDIFVMDAFGTAHRAQATTEGVARFAKVACAGPLLMAELKALELALARPAKPIVAIVGGSKVSSKLDVLVNLADKVDHLVVGGGIANTFLAATGVDVGQSLYEPDLVDTARQLMQRVSVPVPTDVVTAKAFDQPETAVLKPVDEIEPDDMVLDVGPVTSGEISKIVAGAKTIIWNGPMGVFEQQAFAAGTKNLTEAIANNEGFSIAGGGDTLAAIEKYQASEKISYISTGGGAFLEFVEGKTLPAVAVLAERASE
ncbi:MAG: phosphoglycerate kinase [Pseudomonadales bacterium]|nr:phosphoglycerate kinase [Pseudomonadales bacterium]